MQDGGNAVDAAIGVSYALAITEPHSSGLGGGGASLTYNGKDGEVQKCMNIKHFPLMIIKRRSDRDTRICKRHA